MKIYYNTKNEFLNNRNGAVLSYFPNTLDACSGLAQISNRCLRCPIDISIDIRIWRCKCTIKQKMVIRRKKELKFNYIPPCVLLLV